jgi:glycosyltransferase involved in cell wall biosynthesis
MNTVLQMGLVTIAIPAYKNKWLAEAIESALNQDYENIELIIVDDHSPYGLEKIVKPYLKDKRVSYYFNEKNLGKESIVLNWNRCVDLANGEYFVLLCDDDLLMPSFVSTLLSLAEKYPECNVFHGRRAVLNELKGETMDDDNWPEYEDFDSFLKANSLEQRKQTVTEFLYRTNVLKKERYEVFPVGYFSDCATILKMIKNGGIASVSEVTCLFRKSQEHISGNKKYEYGKAKAAILYYNWFQKNIKPSLSDKKKNDALDSWLTSFFRKAGLIDKIRIIFIAPYDVWSYKQKVYMFLSIFGLNILIDSIASS